MGEGFEETLHDVQRHCSPPTPTFIIINDYEKEKKVEKKITKVEEEAKQHVEVEQHADFLLAPNKGGFFDMEPNSHDIHVALPTKVQSKFIMKCKGKE